MNNSIIIYILSIPFLLINYKIIASDLKNKIIPNKFLLYLLLLIPFYYIYIYLNFPEIKYLLFLGQIILTFLVSFILYYLGIWAAGDAKYLLVLSLFIPYIGIVPFIGNIALITILYLLCYFVWFYLWKVLFDKNYRKSLWGSIKYDLSKEWEAYKNTKLNKGFFSTFKLITVFLTFFVTIRLIRLYSFSIINNSNNNITTIQYIINHYPSYLIIILILSSIGIIILIKKIFYNIARLTYNYLKIKPKILLNIFFILSTVSLLIFIFIEYKYHKYEIKNYLFKIFTLYLGFYLIFKILKYTYKITFGIAEYQYINIKDLKKGDIIDKTYLQKIFHFFDPNKNNKEKIKNQINNCLINLENPITNKLRKEIQKSIKLYNSFNKDNPVFEKHNHVRIINTFPFGIYIFFGFIISFFLGNTIIEYIINILRATILDK